jgi:hypothetical protein
MHEPYGNKRESNLHGFDPATEPVFSYPIPARFMACELKTHTLEGAHADLEGVESGAAMPPPSAAR